jgi:DNA-binding transcriptional MocR family regulator
MIEAGSLIRSLTGRHAARNFHTFVINEIGSSIVSGTAPVGSVLASDTVMMEQFGVSRTVLREALKTLEASRQRAGGISSIPRFWPGISMRRLTGAFTKTSSKSASPSNSPPQKAPRATAPLNMSAS